MSMASAATTRRDTQTSSIKPRVLIVEDETALVELLRYNLEPSPMTARRRWPRCRRTRPT